MDIFEWRRAFMTKNGPHPTTRLVLFAISTYMDTEGGNAYPTVRSLAKATGLHRQTVMRRIREARDDGWVKIFERPGPGGIGHRYDPSVPSVVAGDDRNAVAEDNRTPDESGRSLQRGGRSLQPVAVAEDYQTSPVTSSTTSPEREEERDQEEGDEGDPWEEFQKTYPKPHPTQDLQLTATEWKRARAAFAELADDPEAVLSGCRRYALRAKAGATFYVMAPTRWLEERAWTETWEANPRATDAAGLNLTPEQEAAVQRLRELDRQLGVEG